MKISYTICSAWWRGEQDQVRKMLMNEKVYYDIEREKAFAYGKGCHRVWELESQITGKIPAIFKLPQFKVLATEKKLYKQLTKDDWLVGVIDVIALGKVFDTEMLILGDYKAGSKGDDWQTGVYHFLTHDNDNLKPLLGDKKPTHFMYMSLDKTTGETKSDIIKLTYPEKEADWEIPDSTTYTKGLNFVHTVLSEIKDQLHI